MTLCGEKANKTSFSINSYVSLELDIEVSSTKRMHSPPSDELIPARRKKWFRVSEEQYFVMEAF